MAKSKTADKAPTHMTIDAEQLDKVLAHMEAPELRITGAKISAGDNAQVLLGQNIQRLEDECKRQLESAHTSHLRNLYVAFTEEVIENQLNLGKGNGDKQLYNKAIEAFRIYIMDEYGIKDLHLNPFDLITIYMLKKYKHEYVSDIELPHMKSIAEIVNPEFVLQAEGVMLSKIEHIQKEYNSKIEPLKAKLK